MAALAAVVPERWLRPVFAIAIAGLPLAVAAAFVISTIIGEGLQQGFLVVIAMTMMLYGFWCFPALLGFAGGFAARLVFQAAKGRLRS